MISRIVLVLTQARVRRQDHGLEARDLAHRVYQGGDPCSASVNGPPVLSQTILSSNPAVTLNQATIWTSARTLVIVAPIEGYGRLLEGTTMRVAL